MVELAACPNVVCKLSGLTHVPAKPPCLYEPGTAALTRQCCLLQDALDGVPMGDTRAPTFLRRGAT